MFKKKVRLKKKLIPSNRLALDLEYFEQVTHIDIKPNRV